MRGSVFQTQVLIPLKHRGRYLQLTATYKNTGGILSATKKAPLLEFSHPLRTNRQSQRASPLLCTLPITTGCHRWKHPPVTFGVPNTVTLTWALLDILELATTSHFFASASSGDPNNWDLLLFKCGMKCVLILCNHATPLWKMIVTRWAAIRTGKKEFHNHKRTSTCRGQGHPQGYRATSCACYIYWVHCSINYHRPDLQLENATCSKLFASVTVNICFIHSFH